MSAENLHLFLSRHHDLWTRGLPKPVPEEGLLTDLLAVEQALHGMHWVNKAYEDIEDGSA